MIKIGGAGVSGLVAASALANEGRDVTVYEKRTDPMEIRPLVMREDNFSDLKSRLPDKIFSLLSPAKTIYKIEKVSPSGKNILFESSEPIFRVFERGESRNSFENAFLGFLENRAEIKTGNSVNEKDVDILATGFRTPNVFGYGITFESDLDRIIMHYNNDCANRGYTCAIPFSEGRIQILSVHFHPETIPEMRRMFSKTVKEPCFSSLGLEKSLGEVFGFESFFFPPKPRANNTIVCGSAGGFVDASRAFGFYYAIATGHMAAMDILGKKHYEESVQSLIATLREEYERRERLNRLTNRGYEQIVERISEREHYTSISKHVV